MTNALEIEGLSKRYVLNHERGQVRYPTLRDEITGWVRGLVGANGPRPTEEEFWALRDVSFSVPAGQPVGIIGRNGAGKSTLLKIVSRITEPSSGRIVIRGRVASLLEVGTGFHPELTGRENIFLNGAILGMGRSEIRRKFDEIVEFSGIERFLDTPVKRYSSGMYVRLAFAVAAHLEPEILVVDEVLAVGDAAFQKKCLGKMNEVAQGQGRTVLFVSHQLDLVRSLCTRCVLLNAGTVEMEGPAAEVIDAYSRGAAADTASAQIEIEPDDGLEAQILSARMVSSAGAVAATFDQYDPIALEVEYTLRRPQTGMVVSMTLKRSDQVVFMSFDTDAVPQLLEERAAGRYRTRVTLPVPTLKAGSYSIALNLGIANSRHLHVAPRELHFEVDLLSRPAAFLSSAQKRPGMVATELEWRGERVDEA